jgi:hypothetical protein
MNHPGCISGKKVTLFLASCYNPQPRRNSVGVARKELSKSLGQKLL